MQIELITENAEEKMMEELQDTRSYQAVSQGVLHVLFASLGIKFTSDELFPLLKQFIPENKKARIYFCQDGDVMLSWRDMTVDSLKELKLKIFQIVKGKGKEPDDKLYRYYDFNVQNETIWTECQKKVNVLTPFDPTKKKLSFTQEQAQFFSSSRADRKTRSAVVILVVEDQLFSCKLLKQMITTQYRSKVICYVATNYSQALNIYAKHAPNLVLQDIELPYVNGHLLAEFYNTVDPEAYLVMLTANNYTSDLEIAKKNRVKGFIIKPYDKQRILQCINNYFKLTKRDV